jgi:hypothetical protein
MKNAWIVILGLVASPLLAQDSTATVPTTVSVIKSPTATATVEIAMPSPMGTIAPASTSVTAPPMVTPSATPSATAVLPKPPSLNVESVFETPTPGGERFVFQIDGGTVSGVSSAAATQLGLGLGFDGKIAYAFDDFFSIGLESGFYDLSLTKASLAGFGFASNATADMSHIPILVVFQIGLGDQGGPVQPYLTLGAGMALDFNNVQNAVFPAGTTTSWTNFEFDPGLGFTFVLGKNTNLFVQTKLAMDFDNNTAGTTGQTSDTPILFVPIQVGLNFNL